MSNLIPKKIHKSWNLFLSAEIKNDISIIETKLNKVNYTPDKINVLRFLNIDLYNLKVIILGQDPYPEPGRATGRSFEVGDLSSWNDKFKQISLKNIIRLIHKSYNNIEDYKQIKSYPEIKQEFNNRQFNILPPNKLFTSWENQGVLLLNKSLTCEVYKPGSHRGLWADFSSKLISYISTNTDLYWFLWGKDAISNENLISKGTLYKSNHPMMCSEKYENDFLKSNCFKDTLNFINWLG